MIEFFKKYGYEICFFVAGWCAFGALDCILKESYGFAAFNAVLAYANLRLAGAK